MIARLLAWLAARRKPHRWGPVIVLTVSAGGRTVARRDLHRCLDCGATDAMEAWRCVPGRYLR